MKYLAKHQILCFSLPEIKNLFKKNKREEFLRENTEQIDSFDSKKLSDIAHTMAKSIGKDTDQFEIFSAAYIFSDFYDENLDICFYLKDSSNPKKNKINNLNDLKNMLQKNHQVDFLLLDKNGFRKIQLKRYLDPLNTEALTAYVAKTLESYGSAMGDVNLLLLLGSKDGTFADLDLQKLHANILAMGLTFKGEILLSFSLEDKFKIITRIYPTLESRKILIDPSI